MDDYKKPTNDQIGEMAMAACRAAREKALELGLEWFDYALGVERAYNATLKTLSVVAVLGPDGTRMLAELIDKAGAYDAVNEAERIIRND